MWRTKSVLGFLVPKRNLVSHECMEPSDYYDAPIDKVLHFIRSVGLIKG
jgi:hypothetical protein